ncbi:hypothetical protein PV327_000236 [Microctonus hyperodae]|uniref:Uncharacterized protein n=1 Tax=Microctonus hyperodae TaxID=165561 RepID=A0AA39L1Y5_MICHY|nr:hypothetical protein PV327_000236 [Microctonus hyperodae]
MSGEIDNVLRFSGTGGGGAGIGLGIGLPGPLHHSGGTTFMTNNTMTMMTNMMRPGLGQTQCRQPPAYKVAAQMARLHRLGRAHSHEGVTYRTNHEDDDEDAQVSAV